MKEESRRRLGLPIGPRIRRPVTQAEAGGSPGRRRTAGPGGRRWRQQPCPNRPAGRLERRQLPCERRGSRGSGRGRPRRWAGPSGRPGGNPCRVCPRRPHSQKPRRPGKSGAAASIQRPPGSHPSGSLALANSRQKSGMAAWLRTTAMMARSRSLCAVKRLMAGEGGDCGRACRGRGIKHTSDTNPRLLRGTRFGNAEG